MLGARAKQRAVQPVEPERGVVVAFRAVVFTFFRRSEVQLGVFARRRNPRNSGPIRLPARATTRLGDGLDGHETLWTLGGTTFLRLTLLLMGRLRYILALSSVAYLRLFVHARRDQ